MRTLLLITGVIVFSTLQAQEPLVTEKILQQVARVAAPLPGSINELHSKRTVIRSQLDSLQKLISAAFPALADKMKRRSARLNAMTGQHSEGEVMSFVPFNQKFSAYFREEWQKMETLEKDIQQHVKPFYGKEVYKTQGYVAAWDSVYRLRQPALRRYRDGVIKLVKAELAYLAANKKMFESNEEAERMQYVEEELSVLQKLVLLKDRLQKIIVEDGIEKVEYGLRLEEL